MFALSRYQWFVLLAAWLGWGFDVFDALLFNYVAPNAVPVLPGLPIGSPEAKAATPYWTGVLTAMLLVGWAIGGVLFGFLCDRLGRVRTMMLTMLVYALGTAACALAPNLWVFMVFRFLASLGIGGEWAAGASMVAEVVPDRHRVASVSFVERWKMYATLAFNCGGLAGILLSVPIAKRLGRRVMFGAYFAMSCASILWAFGVPLGEDLRLFAYFIVGIGVYGICGTFTYYLPELFPTRLRGTGSGFCYNIGRVVAAPGPFVVGAIAAQGAAADAIFYVGFIPLLGLAMLPLIVETRGRQLL